jgi:hypothetical protein
MPSSNRTWPGEAHDAPARRDQARIPRPVARERLGRAVIRLAVGLDDQPRVRPHEVDLEPLDVGVHQGPRDAVAITQLEELVLERAAGRPLQVVPLEHGGEAGGAGVVGIEDDVEPERLGHLGGLLERASRDRGGEVLEGPPGRGDAEAGVRRHHRRQPRPMHSDRPSAPKPAGTWNGHVDPRRVTAMDSPQDPRAPVAEHGATAGGEHGREIARVAAEGLVAHGVNPAIKGMKPTRGDPPFDRPAVEAERQEVSSGDDTVLRRGEFREALIQRWGCFYTHTVY